MENLVMVFLKHPEPGRVKTRLAARVGAEEAASIYRRLVWKVLQLIPDEPVVWLVFDPPEGEFALREWLEPVLVRFGEAVEFRAQCAGDLGARMRGAFDAAFEAGFARVAVIGTDCVDLDAEVFDAVWRNLDDAADAVFGPAADGGYYLLGLKSRHPELFEHIPWSQNNTLQRSLAAADRAGIVCAMLPVLCDVDDFEDWKRVEGRV